MAAFLLAESASWHEGEEKMHKLMRVPYEDNPTVLNLRPGGGYFVQTSPLMAIGTLDKEGRPWTTVLGGDPGFAGEIAPSIIAARNTVDFKYNPVLEALVDGKNDGEIVKFEDSGRLMAALPIDLENRRRVKLMGRMIAACVSKGDSDRNKSEHTGMAQLVFKVTASLGNCPKYINKKHIVPAQPEPTLISNSPQLPQGAIDLLNRADTLFLSTTHRQESMDTNIRGGPRGFVRILSNEPSGAVLVYPEYSGNRLYQSLGNLQTTPCAGFVFPDFETGNVLYATGDTEIFVGKDAATLLPRSNLVVKIKLTAARYVKNGLPFRGISGDPSPYNPSMRYLPIERVTPGTQIPEEKEVPARLIKKEVITPTIYRFRFQIMNPSIVGKWDPGQYATLSFKDELDMGYSHMQDDDPTSINDDYIRTFTVSSHPGRNLSQDEFEITMRKKGRVTNHLFRANERSGMEVSLRGFDGSFRFESSGAANRILPCIAGGIGITPIIALLHTIDISRIHLYWSVAVRDIGIVHDTFEQFPELPNSTVLFLTGLQGVEAMLGEADKGMLESVAKSNARIEHRRLDVKDLVLDGTEEWYLCGSPRLRKSVTDWLRGKRVICEDFDY
uniref:Pyridoxamine 5'-phosphate oxidase family protein n=1 Tax=Coccidioides posadasii RMSCC 3488 TaxID=454284 RepID=A0A0J6F4Y9_COCPO|nr:pyridoxamine 5'-phosphate oxidase family protein [Coccidioides posadasii RMSCC 3488]